MEYKNSELEKVKVIDVTNESILEKNIKINKTSPSISLEEVTTQNNEINDESYVDDVTYDMQITGDEELEDEEINNDISNMEAPELLEVVVFEELDSMIKVDYYDLERINLEIKVLNEKEEDSFLTDEIKNLKDELENIIRKFEMISKKYDSIYETFEYEKIRQMGTYYIKDLIEEYKTALKNNDILDEKFDTIKDIEEYIGVINTIIEIENRKDLLQEKIDEKLDRFGIRDQEFEKMKEDYYSIDKINDEITKFNNAQSQVLANIKRLVDNSTSIEKNIEYKRSLSVNIGNALLGTLLIASAPFIPHTRRGNMFRIGLIVVGVSQLNAVVNNREKEEVTTNYNVINYEKDINDGISNIKKTIDDIDNAFNDISLLRQKIKNEFSDYIDEIDEVKDLMKNLNKLEKELALQQEIAKSHNNDFDLMLQKNNEKVKKLDK